MKRIHLTLLLLFPVTLLLTGCLDDLDTQPQSGNKLTAKKAWEDPASYEQFLAKIYAGFALSGNSGSFGDPDISAGDQGEATFLRTYWNLQELCTDEVIGAEDNESMRGLYFCRWNSDNKFVALNYSRLYLNIAYANEFLRETTETKLAARGLDEAMKGRIRIFRNEARALRAMNYYFLTDLYGCIPFIDEHFPVGSNDVEQRNRSFFFSWLETELRELVETQGLLPAADKEHYGMVNAPTVWMVLAKMYLNAEVYIGEKRYDDCIGCLGKVLEAGFSLDRVYANIFRADNDLSPEIIFPIVFDGRRAATFGGTTFLIAAACKSDMEPVTTVGFSQAWSNIRSRETLSALFGADDLRALFWKEDRTKENAVWYDFTSGWSVIKYSNLTSQGRPGSNLSHADTDFPFFRLADAYLMYAEAVVRGGRGGSKEQALEYVNLLRDRAGVPRIALIELTLDFLLEERSRELYWEAHRRTDLIRYGKFTDGYKWPWKNEVYAGIAGIDPKYATYPLPATEVAANDRLTQTPGY